MYQEPLQRASRSFPRPSPWLMTPALIVGTWLLSAQAPASDQVTALEKRVADLEARIGKTGNVIQIKAPFEVLGPDGKALLLVAEGQPKTAGVLISRTQYSGVVYTVDHAGDFQTGMGVNEEGHGVVYAFNKAGKIGAQLNGRGGVGVWNNEGTNVALMNATKDGKGRFSVWNGNTKVAALEDSGSGGALFVMKASDGQTAAMLTADGERGGALRVIGTEGKVTAAVMGSHNGGGLLAVAASSGKSLAEVGVSAEGRGLIQVFLPSGTPIAVMGQGGSGTNGGIFQVANAGGVKATLATATTGGGILQLISDGGVPTVEAGTLPNGRGTVRAGPFFKCTPLTASTPIIGIPGWTDCIVGGKEDK